MNSETLKSDLIDIVNTTITHPIDDGYYTISCKLKSAAVNAKNNLELSALLDLLSNVFSMELDPDSINEPFKPWLQLGDRRSTAVDDFDKSDFDFFESIYESIDEPLVRARFADLLWIYLKPKKKHFVDIAISSYLSLSIDSNTWARTVKKCWARAIYLARQIRNIDLIIRKEAELLEAFNRACSEKSFMATLLANFIKKYNLCESEARLIAGKLLYLAQSSQQQKEYYQAGNYYMLAEHFYKKAKDLESESDMKMFNALCYELDGDSRLNCESPSQIAANTLYERALQACRRIPKTSRKRLGVEEKIEELRAKISMSGSLSLDEMEVIATPFFDTSEMTKSAESHVSNKENFGLAMQCFTSLYACEYENIKACVIDEISNFPLSNMFAHFHMARDGRVVEKTPAINLTSQEDIHQDNEVAIEHKAIRFFMQEVQLYVTSAIIPALNRILLEYHITKDSIIELCTLSLCVPKDRVKLMASALWQGFEYNFSDCIYLLAPQVEHTIRVIFKSKGILTSRIDSEGVESENGLSSLLDNPKAEDILGKDFLFELKSIFTESVGFNLRNEVAHGLLSDEQSSSVASIYAWWMMLRLTVRSIL